MDLQNNLSKIMKEYSFFNTEIENNILFTLCVKLPVLQPYESLFLYGCLRKRKAESHFWKKGFSSFEQ